MAWIESHQTLAHHPKTLKLAAELKCGIPAAIGYVHLLWYWGLDYAHDGEIDTSMRDQVAVACCWRGKAETFWMALMQSGFIEASDHGVRIHDWMDYAGRLLARREASRTRSVRARNAQRMHTERAANAQRTQSPTGPTGDGIKPSPLPTPPNPQTDANAQGPAGTAFAPIQPPPKWEEIAPGQFRGDPNGQGEVNLLTVRCPRCERSMPVAEVDGHDCELVPGPPVQRPARPAPGRIGGFLRPPGPPPPEVQEELDRMAANRPTPEQIAAEAARLGSGSRPDQ